MNKKKERIRRNEGFLIPASGQGSTPEGGSACHSYIVVLYSERSEGLLGQSCDPLGLGRLR